MIELELSERRLFLMECGYRNWRSSTQTVVRDAWLTLSLGIFSSSWGFLKIGHRVKNQVKADQMMRMAVVGYRDL